MKVYVTQYALTQGILEIEADVCHRESDDMVLEAGTSSHRYFHKPFWHATREAAAIHANSLVHKKVVSLQKQLKKMQYLRFFA